MREEDKVLLLSEIMGADMSPYVYKYIEELRCSDVYLKLCENVGKARNVHSFKAQRLIDEFELIDFNKIITLQDFFKVSAKVNYLLDNSEAENYINPFFYNEESDLIDTVGQIAIDFDNRRFTLNDIVLDERYTTRYKVDYIKECYLEWRKEIKEMLISPLQSIVIEPQVVADKKLFDDTFITYFIICIVFNIGFIFAPFVPSQFILSIYDGSCHILVTILFSIINVLLFLIDIYFIVVMNYRLNKTRIYRKAKYTIKNSEKILNKINKKCESFYSYILKGVTEKKLLNKNISKFSLDDSHLAAIAYLLKAVESGEANNYNRKNIHGIAEFLFILFGVLIVIMIAIYFMIKGGII